MSAARGSGFGGAFNRRSVLGLHFFECCKRILLPAHRFREAFRGGFELFSEGRNVARERGDGVVEFVDFGFGFANVGFALNVLGVNGNGRCGFGLFVCLSLVRIRRDGPEGQCAEDAHDPDRRGGLLLFAPFVGKRIGSRLTAAGNSPPFLE